MVSPSSYVGRPTVLKCFLPCAEHHSTSFVHCGVSAPADIVDLGALYKVAEMTPVTMKLSASSAQRTLPTGQDCAESSVAVLELASVAIACVIGRNVEASLNSALAQKSLSTTAHRTLLPLLLLLFTQLQLE